MNAAITIGIGGVIVCCLVAALAITVFEIFHFLTERFASNKVKGMDDGQ